MIQSEAQNREPYNNKITLCISYFSSLNPSETVAETTRQSDSPSIVLKTSFSVLSDGSPDQVDSPRLLLLRPRTWLAICLRTGNAN